MEVAAGAHRSVYRPEIDGLRAFAVAAVIMYHADERWLPGGLAGVDVFFVISGYLITGKILQSNDRGAFSLIDFWSRRLRRIVPALLLVLFASSLLAILLLPPDLLKRFGEALVYSVLPASNFYLRYQSGGYFAADARINPLIHMWSLAVEEQFYLLYPVVLVAIVRFKPRWLPVIFALGLVLSLALAIVLMRYRPDIAFYYLPPRAWELMLGGAVALHERKSVESPPPPALAIVLIWLSAAGLLSGLLLRGTGTNFPWPGAVLPCVATAALLAFLRPENAVTRVLSAGPFVFVGLISYSLYLWHQPAFAFARLVNPASLALADSMLIICGIFLVSWLSWRFLEQPLRQSGRISNARAIAGMAIIATTLIAGGIAARAGDGWRSRFSTQQLALMEMSVAGRLRSERCASDDRAISKCNSTANWPPEIAILGDSHAYAFATGFTPLANRNGTGVITLWSAGCPPLVGRSFAGKREAACMRLMDSASQNISANRSVRKVILVARWARHLELSAFDNGEGGVEAPYLFDVPRLDEAKLVAFQTGLINMVDRLRQAGKQVIIMGPVPEAGWSVPDYLWKAELLGKPALASTLYSRFVQRQSRSLRMLARVAVQRKVPVVYPHEVFCMSAAQRCITANGQVPFYYDDDHLSPAGAEVIARHYKAQLLQQ
ncbi:acyltransferase family protein [Novosphingobium sp.]|uniref:acyltransferase family protein n=1 Tax=Novosphingobium sp. TaxID=1874826 RepID=UPI00261BD4CF|nr:acyltransferase family protein [Novosphingobium sp.]